jgi:hypothetical protein
MFQEPFHPTHQNVENLKIKDHGDAHVLAATLRRVFSAIVSGNVKPEGIKAVEEHGPFTMRGEEAILSEIDELLAVFLTQRRMRRVGEYKPCYRCMKSE